MRVFDSFGFLINALAASLFAASLVHHPTPAHAAFAVGNALCAIYFAIGLAR